MTTEATNQGDTGADQGAAATAADAATGAATEAVVTGGQAQGDAAGAADVGTALVRPEGLDDAFWDDATGLKTGDLVSALRDLQAKDAERTAGVPAEGEAYDLALPEGFQVPEGYAVEIKADDPLWADFQSIAREAGLPKGDFGKFVGAFAKYQIAAQQADVNAFVAEKTKLGANADARIKAAETYLTANLPKVQADALGGALLSADGIQGLERLINIKSGPVAATGAGASGVNKFDGLHGGDLLDAVRSAKAA